MNMTKKQFEVLVCLEAHRATMSQREIAKQTGISVGSVNKILSDLGEEGLAIGGAITDKGVAAWLGKPEWKVRNEIHPAMRCYTGRRVMEILSLIRQTDAAGKGVGGCKTPPGELLLELVYRILE